MLDNYISELCDKYAHFGEFVSQELIDQGKSKRGVRLHGISLGMLQRVINHGYSIGAASSAALGAYLGAPPDHYERLQRLFVAEKKRRAAL